MTDAEEINALNKCNEGELLTIARIRGLGILRGGLARDRLIAIIRGEINPTEQDYAGTMKSRMNLEQFIAAHFEQVRSQLPGCDGKCTTFGCSEGRHALCFLPNVRHVK